MFVFSFYDRVFGSQVSTRWAKKVILKILTLIPLSCGVKYLLAHLNTTLIPYTGHFIAFGPNSFCAGCWVRWCLKWTKEMSESLFGNISGSSVLFFFIRINLSLMVVNEIWVHEVKSNFSWKVYCRNCSYLMAANVLI